MYNMHMHMYISCSQKVLLSNRTYQDLRGYAHALRTSLRELVCDSLRVCVKCGCVVLVWCGGLGSLRSRLSIPLFLYCRN